MNKVVNHGNRPKCDVPIKDPLQELIEQCLTENSNHRPTFDENFSILANKTCDENNLLQDEVNNEQYSEITDITEKL